MRDNDDPVLTERTPVTPPPAYVSPRIERLGTLAELTLGGSDIADDGDGGSGDDGSLP